MGLWAARCGLALLGIVLALLAFELALQTLGPVLPGRYSAHMYGEPHPIYGYSRVPRSTGWVKSDEFMARVEINSHGLREREIPYAKPAGLRRILVLGDSFVEGVQVPAELTATRRLESLLNDGGRAPVQVINAGIGAWSTAQEYLFLKHEGRLYEPDLVVLMFFTGNDVSDNSYRVRGNLRTFRKPYFVLSEGGELQMLPWRPKQRHEEGLIEQLRRESLLFGVFDASLPSGLRSLLGTAGEDEDEDQARIGRDLLQVELPVFSTRPARRWLEAWQITEALLASIRDESSAAQAPLLLVTAPTIWEVYPEEWDRFRERHGLGPEGWDFDEPNRRLAEISVRQDIAHLDLRPALRQAAGTGRMLYFRHDPHWTAAGHEAVARALADYLFTTSPSIGPALSGSSATATTSPE